jgi:RNA polymerase sigma factor (sigma-70 family)
MTALYVTSALYGVGSGIWLDALVQLSDPGIAVIMPIALGIETVAHDAFAHDGPGPAEEAEADAARRQLDSAWRRLEKDQRVLLALHDVEGYSLAEITAITGLKEGTIKSRLHRARVKLGRLFRHEEGALRAALARRTS